MISDAMPRITLGASLSMEQFAQALAFTYLSKYSGEAIQPRVQTAFERAWGVEQIKFLAPGTDNNPGACLAFWRGVGLNHCLVAMPGAQTFPGLWAMFSGIGYHSVEGCSGSVFHAFRTRAYTMWDRLFADADFVTALANPRTVFTFTGHSLGGAMAEILAYRFKAANPTVPTNCIKFGSPRVGTSRWVDNANPSVRFASIYHNRDPIHAFPQVFSSLSPLAIGPESLILRNFARDGSPWRFVYNHATFVNTFLSDPFLGSLEYAANAVQGGGTANPWFDHTLGAYRLMMQNYCGHRPDVMKYRFNFLEFNDENMFHVLFQNGLREWEDIHWLNPTQPDPVRVISADVGLVANAPRIMQQIAPIREPEAVEIGDGGADFGPPKPISAAYSPRRIVRQAPFNN